MPALFVDHGEDMLSAFDSEESRRYSMRVLQRHADCGVSAMLMAARRYASERECEEA